MFNTVVTGDMNLDKILLPWLLKIFQILPFVIGGLAAIVVVILVLGYLGILSSEQIKSIERLGTGLVSKNSN